jgi:hypothetical protein
MEIELDRENDCGAAISGRGVDAFGEAGQA